MERDSEQFLTINCKGGLLAHIPFKQLFEWINEGFFCVDGEGTIVFANDQFCQKLGYKRNEIIQTSVFDYFYSDDYKKIARQKLELRKKGLSDVYEAIMRKKNGEPLWSRLSGRPVFDKVGNFVASVVIHSDITKQKYLEQELILAKEDLEIKIKTRTRELSEANQKLNEQIRERKLAEISKKHSEKRFRDVYQNSPDAIYIESLDGVILDVNDATCRLHESTAEELIGKTIYDLAPEHVHEDIRQRQPKLISGEINKFESECITRSGTVKPIEISTSVIEFNDRPALLVHVRDITDRKQKESLLRSMNLELEEMVRERTAELQTAYDKLKAEIERREIIHAELQRQKDSLRQILDALPNLVFVKDTDGKFLLANEAVARYYGLQVSEMEGHYDSEYEFTHEDLLLFKEQDELALQKNGELVSFPERKYHNIHTGKETWLKTVKKAIPAYDGKGMYILGVANDVTEIKKAKEELDRSEQLYRSIARNLPKAAMFIFDRDLRYILAEGPLIGYISKPKEQIEGKTIYETIGLNELPKVEELYRNILNGNFSEMEQTYAGRHLKVHHIPIRDDEGNIIYGMVMVFDITDLKDTQKELEIRAAQLQRSNEELERFAYVASHDLQGPLRTIASYLQLLEMRYKDKLGPDAIEFIDFSVKGAKRLQNLIQDLLSYSRLHTTPKPFVRVKTSDVVNVVLMQLKSTLEQTNASVQVGHLPDVHGDPGQLVLLFQNLIDNAIKFVKDKPPHISISATELPEHIQFSIKDNGIGIREDFKERIFEIFQRLHNDSEYPGTGIGLAICKKIVELHHGKIWFESEEGTGTTFHFTILKPDEYHVET
ncbi:MAG: PAS domain S-box protein [Chitinophagales bacterium]|nr:PAS domain S-box protein [Chitinophagales bacterium]MDW8418149.1 PAS domain S-box protein [Chitinophagales bacterium]